MKRNNIFFLSIFTLAMVLRLLLCVYNREANDDHMEAISLIADRQAIPDAWECAECFQPKLYYVLSAGVLILFDIQEPVSRIITIQLLNLVMSFFILLFTWKFLQSKPFSENVKLMTFALAALNPSIAGINSQVTNDTLIILIGVLTIYYADRYFRSLNRTDAMLLVLFTVISPIAKGSGLVIALAVLIIFLAHILFSSQEFRKRFLQMAILLVMALVTIVPFAGGYYYSYVHYGTPFSTGIGSAANIKSSEPFRWRPGIQSVAGGYLTFRLVGMLEQPYITNDPDTFPLHRTSVWSQLYGRTFFMHFDQHPPSWKSTEPVILNAGRVALLLGLIPALLFITGIFKSVIEFIKTFRFNLKRFIAGADWQHLVFIGGFIGFIVMYTRDYPDFSTMKSVFLLPALPAFLLAFAKGWNMVNLPALQKSATVLMVLLIAVHVFDIAFLIAQLS